MSLNRQSWSDNFWGSEMGTLMNNIDWHSTAVGSVDTWPKSLQTAVDICLGSKFPMVIWWGPDYTMFYNDAYRPMLGLSKHPQYLGKSGKDCWSEIWHILGPMMENVLQTGQATWSENLLLHMNRNNYIEETYFTFSYSPLLNDQGEVYGIFNACTETTGQVLGERRLKTLRSMIEGKTAQEVGLRAIEKMAENPQDIPFAILYLSNDAENKLTLAGITGFNNENICRNEIDLASPITPLEMHLEKVLYSGKAVFVDDLPSLFRGVPYGPWAIPPKSAIFLPVTYQGQERLSAILILGISAHLAFDDEYKSFFDLIAGHVSTAIATARAYEEERRRVESLAELNQAKIDFFSSISHEFRTPLTLMLSPLEELIHNHAETLSPECREQLHMIQRNGLRLFKLVNTLLDFSRIEAKRIEASYVQTDLTTFTQNLASEFRSVIEKAGLLFDVDCRPSPPAYIDKDMWEKIVLNLISNAFKHTFEGSIKISLAVEDERINLSVTDTGVGIASDQLNQIFERFHRVQDVKSRSHEGTGIGQSLVKELVNLHGGTISVRSVPGQGSTFTVTIPLGNKHLPDGCINTPQAPKSPAAGANPYIEEARRWLFSDAVAATTALDITEACDKNVNEATITADKNYKILIVDDNQDMLYYLDSLLNKYWFVFTASDGLSGLNMARSIRPDLILTDVMMPVLDGFGLLKEIRNDLELKDTPVIMLSARAGDVAKIGGFEAGADDYLIKPFYSKELLARVRANLELSKMRNNIDELMRKKKFLRQSEQKFSKAFHNDICMMALIDFESTQYIDVNTRFAEAIGFSREELINKTVSETGMFTELNLAHILNSFKNGNCLSNCEIKIKTKSDEIRDVYLSSDLIALDTTKCIMLIAIDVTEKKMYLNEITKLDRLNMVGQMAAGISHEIRNPLTTVKGYLQLFEKKKPFEPYREQFNLMIEELDRASGIITEFLSLAKNKLMHQEKCHLSELVSSITPLIEAGAMLESKTVLSELLPTSAIFADPKEIRQLILNLAKNGLEAMGSHGTLTLKTYDEGGCPILAITDEGCGIPSEMLAKLGTPFMTTKAHGTGLGLPICYSIADRHNAKIEVNSNSTGTEFCIYFKPHV